MPWTETVMRTGQQFSSVSLTRQVGNDLVSLAIAANNDPSRFDYASQTTVTVNDAPAIVTALRIQDGNCESVIEYGPKCGGGVLHLSWTLKKHGDAMHATGSGEWNGAPIEPFDMVLDNTGKPADAREAGSAELILADGTRADTGEIEADTARALAGFAKMVRDSSELDPGLRNACVAGCTAGAAACALACAALTGPAFPLCGKGCVLAQSACVAGCAAYAVS